MIFIVLGLMETSKLDGEFMQFAFQYRPQILNFPFFDLSFCKEDPKQMEIKKNIQTWFLLN